MDHDPNNYKSLRDYSKNVQDFIGLNLKQITSKVGRKAEHFFYHSFTQFSFPTESTYNELIKVLRLIKWKGLNPKTETLRQEYETLRQEYETKRYTHNLDPEHNVVWRFKSSNSGKLHLVKNLKNY